MISFTELVTAAQAVRGLLAKGRGHKYIKRIPVGQTPSGGIKYRYIYKETHTVGGKHLLDEAHLKVGTKLLLEDGVHAHITEVKGDKVTFVYDDGDRKGEEKTLTKQKLLSKFDEAHDVGAKIDEARKQAQAEYMTAVYNKTASEKQRKRLYDRIKRLTREIPNITKPDVEVLPSGTGRLSKEIIDKHSVDVNLVASSLSHWRGNQGRQESNIDVMFMRRLERIDRDGIERAVSTYNEALNKAAADNAGVLAAVEAYRELIDPYNSPEQLNALTQRRVAMYESFIKSDLRDITGVEDKGDLTYADLKGINKRIGWLQYKVDAIERDTGINIQETGQTIKEAYGQLNPRDHLAAKYRREAAQTAEAQLLREEVRKQISLSCDVFSFENSKYTEGDMHPSHKLAAGSKRSLSHVVASAYRLAHVEDVFQSAYPSRDQHTTTLATMRKGGRADCFTSSTGSIISCPSGATLRTRVHELAHTLEGQSTTRGNLQSEIVVHRTIDERNNYTEMTARSTQGHADYQLGIQEAVTLSHLTRIKRGAHSSYSGNERAYDDEYHDLYAGKMYATGSSEFVTMGVQEMFASTDRDTQMRRIADFALKDPHHYLVTYGILKGYTKHE